VLTILPPCFIRQLQPPVRQYAVPWVFGQAIEDAFGSRIYTTFYLVNGGGNMNHWSTQTRGTEPGASGTIAG
jgi:membrane associated rhomboid family serine protease